MRQVKISEPPSSLSWPAGWRKLGDTLSRKLWLLESDSLCAEARHGTRLEDFGEPPIDPALSVLTESLESEAELHPHGRFLMRVHLRELLQTRLRLTLAWNGQSNLREASAIKRPIFITGIPRSGSTFLHELLAEDPENRVPRVWEVMFPIPTGSEHPKRVDPRLRKAKTCLWWFRRFARGADSVYPIRAWTPHECVAIHSYTFLSEEFVSTCYVPTYEAFLHAADLGPIYRWQKRFLQYLQMGSSNRRWVLKSPDHIYGLDKLLTVFPDAAIIQTHRNPVEVLKSQIRLTKVLEAMFARPREQLAISEARKIEQMLGYITRFRDAYPNVAGQFIDVMYSELVSDPLAVVRRIYERLDIRLTELADRRMRRLASARSRYKEGRGDSPALADLGLHETVDLQFFEDYCARFGVSR
ncbi:MAG: sulfotransferase [Verrucomicrobia bacterium]|nr:sulfotransferase [Verrucomicrobiota bacterium]